jgi:hypothetical protein
MQHWFINRPFDNGGTYYRHLLPLRHLMPELHKLGVRVTFAKRLDLDRHFDAYFFSRWVDLRFIPMIRDLKDRGARIIWDLDDDLLDIDRHYECDKPVAAPMIEGLHECLDLADLITASMDHLACRIDRLHKTAVVPNLIDLDDNPPLTYCDCGNSILYTGSPSHAADLELVRDLHGETDRDFPWIFYGIKPKWLTRHDTWIPWSRVSDYPKVCRLARPWLSLCPLEPCLFNESKSPIKVWETATLGSSVLASDTGPYRGHPAAMVPEGEAFGMKHLQDICLRPNTWACIAEARAHSWQESADGRQAWLDMFQRVLTNL